jgi:hypothetical protein
VNFIILQLKLSKNLKLFVLGFILLLPCQKSWSQVDVKLNLATVPFLVPNAGIAFQTKERQAVQLDVLGSFWDEFPLLEDSPLHLTQIFFEYRWYQKEGLKGWFVAPHIGFGMYTMERPNFLFIKGRYGTPDYERGKYRSGRVAFYGVTFGYTWALNQKWALEAFVGVSLSQAMYKGYRNEQRVDIKPEDAYIPFNGSGEVGVYRGGLMLIYKIKYTD